MGDLYEREERTLKTIEMCTWRRMVKINWTETIRTEELLKRTCEDRTIIETTKKRKMNWLGHLLKGKEEEVEDGCTLLLIVLKKKNCTVRQKGKPQIGMNGEDSMYV